MKSAIVGLLALVASALVILVAVALAFPDRLPSILASSAKISTEDSGLYCEEHGIPEKFCTLCHEELKKTLLLCKEHGDAPEDVCTLCHPEVREKHRVRVCKEHGAPEAYCVLCGNGQAAASDAPDDGWCSTHGRPEELCDECRRNSDQTRDTSACRQSLPIVRLASARLARQIGIETAEVTREEHAHLLTANAETAYDANHYAEITPRVAGFLREVRADLGKQVRRGDVIAVVDSSEVSGAKAQFITAQAAYKLAKVTYDRTKALSQTGSVAARAELESLTGLNQAKAASLDAEQRLRNFGFGNDELDRIVREDDPSPLLNVVSPMDGVVVARHAVKGEPVQAVSQIFSVTDTVSMWLWIDIYESDVESVKLGQLVQFTVSGGAGGLFEGSITWIGTEVNPQTRTTRIRAELSNPDGRLRSNQFGQAVVRIGEPHEALVVPKSAVQRKDDVEVVFLPGDEPGVYRPQRILTEPSARRDVVEVAWGLEAGQRVVSRGAFLLKTEIMKGAIGAGCCE